MRPKILPNKPLIEAILELKWKPSVSANGVDADFRLFLGRFHDYVSKDYPAFEVLPAAAAPEQVTPHVASYRFRRSEGGWPLVQLGSGVLTVNETTSYRWQDYRERVLSMVDLLFLTYPGKLEPVTLELRYINAVNVDFANEDVVAYLAKKFRLHLTLPASLFDEGNVRSAADLFVLQAAFPSKRPEGFLRLNFAKGKANDKDAIVWETVISSAGEGNVPKLPEGFEEWLDSAHDLAENCFFKLIEGELLQQFS